MPGPVTQACVPDGDGERETLDKHPAWGYGNVKNVCGKSHCPFHQHCDHQNAFLMENSHNAHVTFFLLSLHKMSCFPKPHKVTYDVEAPNQGHEKGVRNAASQVHCKSNLTTRNRLRNRAGVIRWNFPCDPFHMNKHHTDGQRWNAYRIMWKLSHGLLPEFEGS